MVKILDFGLAKSTDPSSLGNASGDVANSPTATMGATVAGTILGTAAYMSPEQARGRSADRRSDIFSFGVVLYELLTGKGPFGGETAIECMAAVLNKEPDWTLVPARAERLLRWCLEKDRKKRLASISDARRLLEESLTPSPAPVTMIEKTPPSKLVSGLPWALAAAFGLALIGFAGFYFTRPAPSVPDAVSFTFDPPSDYTLTNMGNNSPQLAVSPDGRYVAFVAQDKKSGGPGRTIWVRALGALSAQKLDKTEDADFPFWSPDSKNIAFFADKKLKRIAVTGGSPINLSDAENGNGGTWFQPEGSTEGVILFSVFGGLRRAGGASALLRVPAAGGVAAPATKLASDEVGHIFPQFLPDGKRFLYFALASDASKRGIYVQTLGSDQRTFLLNTQGRAVFAPPDLLLYMRDNTLLAQHWDWNALKPLGEPLSVADNVRSGGQNGRNAFSAAATVLAYRAGAFERFVYNWHTREGKLDVPAWAWDKNYDYQHIELSPDNKRVAVVRRSGYAAPQDIFLAELDGGVESRITSTGRAGDPVWSPDSRRLIYAKRSPDGKAGLYHTLVGSGKETLVYPDYAFLDAWTREGLVSFTRNGTDATTVVLLEAPGENVTEPMAAKPRTLLEVPYSVDQIRVSPDGTRVAYTSGESGGPEVWVAAFPSFADRHKIAEGAAALWRADGKELVFHSITRVVMAVDVKTGPVFSAGIPKALFPWNGFTAQVHNYAMTSDGKRFLRLDPAGDSEEIEPMHLVLNWPSLVRK